MSGKSNGIGERLSEKALHAGVALTFLHSTTVAPPAKAHSPVMIQNPSLPGTYGYSPFVCTSHGAASGQAVGSNFKLSDPRSDFMPLRACSTLVRIVRLAEFLSPASRQTVAGDIAVKNFARDKRGRLRLASTKPNVRMTDALESKR